MLAEILNFQGTNPILGMGSFSDEFIKFLKDNNCSYYDTTMDWTDLGTPEERVELSEGERERWFKTCFVQDCAGIYEGNLYHCPRIYALENMGVLYSKGDEVIRFDEIHSWDEMHIKLEKFYKVQSCAACEWCNAPEDRCSIPSAEQIVREKNRYE